MPTSPIPALPADPPALIARQTTAERDSAEGAGPERETGSHRTQSEASSDPEGSKTSADPDGSDAHVEVTLFEADRDPDERTTRWITAAKADCVPEAEWC